jgi:hypothetical protein
MHKHNEMRTFEYYINEANNHGYPNYSINIIEQQPNAQRNHVECTRLNPPLQVRFEQIGFQSLKQNQNHGMPRDLGNTQDKKSSNVI